jgi:DNA-directed RNA polymerase subunit M/transcription elongation factor TFIIS
MKQSSICPQCSAYMGFVKENQWLKCPSCGYMTKVVKRIIKPIGFKNDKARRT